MKLAIVVPYFKTTFFEKTIQSLANQSNKEFTVYIGDDFSPKTPLSILDYYRNQLSFEYKRFDRNLGGVSLVKQWERCLEMVKDEEQWVMILGDDDLVGSNVVEEFYKNIEEIEMLDIKVIRYATTLIDENDKIISKKFEHPKIEKSTDFIFRKSRSSLSEYIFNKAQLNKVKFKDFPLGWCADHLGILEFSDFKDVFSINTANVLVRKSNVSISGNKNENIKEKKVAQVNYYYYLLRFKSLFFTISQRKVLMDKIDRIYINAKKDTLTLKKVLYLHIFTFRFKYFISFLHNVLKSIKFV